MFNLLKNMKTEDLIKERNGFQAWIDGQENNGRTTSDNSFYLDHCFDMIEEINKELEARKVKRIIPLFTGEFHCPVCDKKHSPVETFQGWAELFYLDIENWMAGKY